MWFFSLHRCDITTMSCLLQRLDEGARCHVNSDVCASRTWPWGSELWNTCLVWEVLATTSPSHFQAYFWCIWTLFQALLSLFVDSLPFIEWRVIRSFSAHSCFEYPCSSLIVVSSHMHLLPKPQLLHVRTNIGTSFFPDLLLTNNTNSIVISVNTTNLE